MPVIDRDEPRFAQASKQMITSGNYLDIRFQQEPRYKKPIGIYWPQGASALLFGKPPYDEIAPYRLPSLIGAIIAVLITAWGISRIDGARTGLLAGLILICTPLLNFEARIAKTDAVLLALVCAAQFILARVWVERNTFMPACAGMANFSASALLFWLAQAAGILIKGPMLPLVSIGTIGVLCVFGKGAAWLKQLRPLPGLLLCTALVAPWLLWISFASQGSFYNESVGHDLLGKILTGQDRGFLPPGYHLLILPVFFGLPFGLALTGMALGWRRRHDPVWRFILAWVAPLWLANELIATKLPHYLLPCYPALAWAAARLIMQGWPEQSPRARLLFTRLTAICILAMPVIAITIVILPLYLELPLNIGLLIFAAIALKLFLLHMRWQKQSRDAAMLCGLGGTASLMVAGFGFLMPMLSAIMIAPQAEAHYRALRPCPFSRLVTSGASEPSLVFTSGTNTIFANGAPYAAALLARDRCAVGMIAAGQEAEFQVAMMIEGAKPHKYETMRAYNYNGGGWQEFAFYRADGETVRHDFPY